MSLHKMLLLATLGLLGGCIASTDAPNPDAGRGVDESGVPIPPQPTLTADELASFKAVHLASVEQFAGIPTVFGGQRMVIRPALGDVVTPAPSDAANAGKNDPSKVVERSPGLLADQAGQVQQPGSSDAAGRGENSKIQGLSPRLLADNAGQSKRDIHLSFRGLLNQRRAWVTTPQPEYWQIKDIQLVGLTVNPHPVVYETDKVPGMKDIGKLPTRELNAFEKRGLAALKSGEALKLEFQAGGLAHMMGPIFAGKSCLKCHEQSGQLLGAFSYVLERTKDSGVIAP